MWWGHRQDLCSPSQLKNERGVPQESPPLVFGQKPFPCRAHLQFRYPTPEYSSGQGEQTFQITSFRNEILAITGYPILAPATEHRGSLVIKFRLTNNHFFGLLFLKWRFSAKMLFADTAALS